MKKKLCLIILLLIIFIPNVSAQELNCENLKTIEWFQKMFDYIKIIAPILAIVLGSYDYIKAIYSFKDDALSKSNSKFAKRLIAAALLFILPSALSFILSFAGDSIDTNLCGIK